MSAEFVGYTNVQHVQQPEGTELCFPSIVSAMTGTEISNARDILRDAGVAKPDGSVGLMMGETELKIGGGVLTVEQLELTSEDPENVMRVIDEQFAVGEAVALLHKKTGDPQDDSYHWILLTGYCETDDEHKEKGPIYTIDPLQEEAGYIGRRALMSMIRNSTDYNNGGQGIYPYAIRNSLGSRPEPVQQLLIKFK